MLKTPAMVDMRRTDEEKRQDMVMPYGGNPSEYPYGLSICLDDACLEKLDVDVDSLSIGETYHLFVMAKVTSISSNENANGPEDRVELQITHMSAESEDAENSESRESLSKKMYKK